MGEASNSLDVNMIILFADADIKDIFQRNTSMQQKQKAVAKVINGMKWSTDKQFVHMYDIRHISSFLSRTPCSCPAEKGLNQQNCSVSLGP